MAFDYPVTLNLRDRPCLVAGSGPLAIERLTGLLRSRALVTVVTPRPSPGLAAQCAAFDVPLMRRAVMEEDMEEMAVVIVTREDEHDIPALHAAASASGALFAALDDVAHCDFGAMSQVLRGPLKISISSSGRAPALAKRLRKRLEEELEHELTDLAEAISRVRREHGPRTVPFDEWARRWEVAMEDLDGLLALLAVGRVDEVERRIMTTLLHGATAGGGTEGASTAAGGTVADGALDGDVGTSGESVA